MKPAKALQSVVDPLACPCQVGGDLRDRKDWERVPA